MTLHAYHDSHELKSLYLHRVLDHRRRDELVQGTGWVVNGKTRGCAVGCTLDAYDHAGYPIELGIPQELARLEDQIFEVMPRAHAIGETPKTSWPYRFLAAIDPGADLSQVWPQWAVWMLVDPKWGVSHYAKNIAQTTAIERVAQLYREGGSVDEFRRAAAAAGAAGGPGEYVASSAASAAAVASGDGAAFVVYAAYAAYDASFASCTSFGSRDDLRRGKWAVAAADKLLEILEAA